MEAMLSPHPRRVDPSAARPSHNLILVRRCLGRKRFSLWAAANGVTVHGHVSRNAVEAIERVRMVAGMDAKIQHVG